MAGIICELCGGGTLVRQGNGMYVCKDCGTEYTLEAARQLLQGGTPAPAPAPAPVQTTDDGFVIADGTLVRYKGIYRNVTIPHGVTALGKGCFRGRHIKEVSIPNTVTEIGDAAFAECLSLHYITIPRSVTTIGREAFAGSRLRSVKIPDSVRVIGPEAFAWCTELLDIQIPDGVTEIGSGAFRGCTGLGVVTLPNSVTVLGASAFGECTRLFCVTVPGSLREGAGAFMGCLALDPAKVDAPTTIEHLFLGTFDSRRNCPHCAGKLAAGKCTRCGRTI